MSIDEIGEEHLYPTLDVALERSKGKLEVRQLLGTTGRRQAMAS